MLNKTNIFSMIGAILLLAVAGYLGYRLVIIIGSYAHFVSPNAAAAIIAGLVTVIGYFISRNFERKKIIEQQIRERKLPVYEEFINFLFKVLSQSKSSTPVSDSEMEEFMIEFNKKSIIWLSDESLLALVKWRKSASDVVNNNDTTVNSLFIMEDLLLQFRKDIGHDNKNLKKGDLLTLFVNDLEQYL